MLSLIGNWDYLKYVGVCGTGLTSNSHESVQDSSSMSFRCELHDALCCSWCFGSARVHEAAAVTFLFAISEALESKATSRARNALSAIICLRPEHANVINPVTKDIVVIPATAVAVGSLVRVRTGDKVPCDGVVVEGSQQLTSQL
eukprot:CCRYP_013604-RA/>CCRYP_013604-RA protein AED:0.46 eAED:0.46 QI:0/0/0/1/0/0/2/0/144